MKATFMKGIVVGAVVSTVTLFSTAALAGTGIGGVFNLGKTNTVDASTALSGSTNGQQLAVKNTSTDASATGLGIRVAAGKPPLEVNSSAKVAHLDADLLDGKDSGTFQQRVTGSCPDGESLTSVGADGTAGCTASAVIAIAQTPPAGGEAVQLLPSDLEVNTACHEDGDTSVSFYSDTQLLATVNWMYDDGSTVHAGGTTLEGGSAPFDFTGGRLEGQWIYANPRAVTTVNLHVYDAGDNCEVRGTAEVVAIPLTP